MRKIWVYSLFSLVLAAALAVLTKLTVPESMLNTLYTVAGVIFSVGMSITVSPKTESVMNMKMRKSIRTSYLNVRNSFMLFFAIDTLLLIASSAWSIAKYPSALDLACAIFTLLSIAYFVYNFMELQNLGNQIEDQIMKEQERKSD